MADEYKYEFYEVSALKETGLDEMFSSMTRKAKKKHESNTDLVNTKRLKKTDNANNRNRKSG